MPKKDLETKPHLYSAKSLRRLLLPIMVEQLLSSLMGTADTIMVSNVGSSAISAVSLVDSINVLVIQAFSALAAGGAILCSQYLGNDNKKEANRAASQVLFVTGSLSILLSLFCLIFRTPLLRLIFGSVEEAVMQDSQTYFFFTLLSFPFIGLYDAGASIFRSQNNTRGPMTISVISNFMNIFGNAVLICRQYLKIRPCWPLIRKILSIGIPSGVENSMFQFGKLSIQSTVSTLGTAAIAAQAMTNILENLNGIAAMGVGIGLMTVVGQCIGAGRKDEAVYYVKKLSWFAELVLILSCLTVFAAAWPITVLGGMEAESARMCLQMIAFITVVKPLVWIPAFIPAYGMRAAGDVKYSMIVSCASMWIFRVSLCIILCRFLDFGPMGVWIAMFTDWTVRGAAFLLRFHSRRWLDHKVI